MKISQAMYILGLMQQEMGDVEMVVMLPANGGFESFEVDLIAGIGLPDEKGVEQPTCAIFDPQLAEDFRDEMGQLDEQGRPKLVLIKNQDEGPEDE